MRGADRGQLWSPAAAETRSRPANEQDDAGGAFRRMGQAEVKRPEPGGRSDEDAGAKPKVRQADIAPPVSGIAGFHCRAPEPAAREDRRFVEPPGVGQAAKEQVVAVDLPRFVA